MECLLEFLDIVDESLKTRVLGRTAVHHIVGHDVVSEIEQRGVLGSSIRALQFAAERQFQGLELSPIRREGVNALRPLSHPHIQGWEVGPVGITSYLLRRAARTRPTAVTEVSDKCSGAARPCRSSKVGVEVMGPPHQVLPGA